MTIHFSPFLHSKIVLTERQNKNYLADVEKYNIARENRETLIKQLSQPMIDLVTKTLQGKENPLDRWENDGTIEGFKQDMIVHKSQIVKRASGSHDFKYLVHDVQNLFETEIELKTTNENMHKVIRAIFDDTRSKMETIKIIDPYDYLSAEMQNKMKVLK